MTTQDPHHGADYPVTNRLVRCRVANEYGNRCTAEALDPLGPILICEHHAALVLELVGAAR